MQSEVVMTLTDPTDSEVLAALTRRCSFCGVRIDEYCRDTTVRKGEPPRLLRDNSHARRPVHYGRLIEPPPPKPRAPRKPKPPARRAPVGAARPIEVSAKDLRRKA